MLGLKEKHFKEHISVSVEYLVPQKNFYRQVEAKLDLQFVTDLVKACYDTTLGRPSIDPVVFFKLYLIMFFEGIRSERQLMEMVNLNLAHRWYIGYDLDEAVPDHSSLSKIRTRYGVEVFQRFFEQIVELCIQAGLVWGQELYFDGTKVRANASVESMMPRWAFEAKQQMKTLFGEAAKTDEPPPEEKLKDKSHLRLVTEKPASVQPSTEEQPQIEPVLEQATESKMLESQSSEQSTSPANQTPSSEQPEPLKFAGEGVERKASTAGRLWMLEKYDGKRLNDQRTSSYQRTTDEKVSPTDPDATPMSRFNGDKAKLGYHDHYVVDGGKARIILGVLVTPSSVMDNTPMLDLCRWVRFRWHIHPEIAVGDTKYGTVPNIVGLEQDGLKAYTPVKDSSQPKEFYHPEKFTYDAERDVYTCPAGQELSLHARRKREELVVYRADAKTCDSCQLKAKCTNSKSGRHIFRSFHQATLDKAEAYRATEPYKKAMRKRSVWVEPLFGEAKQWHQGTKFRLRRLQKVNIEGVMRAAGQNIKRLLNHKERGKPKNATPGAVLQIPFFYLLFQSLHCRC